jgi:hypothetical protein
MPTWISVSSQVPSRLLRTETSTQYMLNLARVVSSRCSSLSKIEQVSVIAVGPVTGPDVQGAFLGALGENLRWGFGRIRAHFAALEPTEA